MRGCIRYGHVFDRYDIEHTIKPSERHRRSKTTKAKTYSVKASRPIPRWKDLMGIDANETALTQFLTQESPKITKKKTVDNRRFIPVNTITVNLHPIDPIVRDILLAVHILTGCESVSPLYFIGKKSAMNVFEGDKCVAFENLLDLGSVGVQIEDIA